MPNHTTRDQFVFLITSEKIDAKAFHQLISEDNSQQHNNYYVNLFLLWLDQQKPIVTAELLLETIPR